MAKLQIYNTFSKSKEEFQPRVPGQVSIYVCGPTVYDFLHIGNFRGPVVFNLIRNWLIKSGYQVNYVANFTDIDDKIIQRAQKEGIDSAAVSEKYIKEYQTDFQSLGLHRHDKNPKVTEHLKEIIEIIEKLLSEQKAYVVDGEVLYSIRSFDAYGELSKRDIDDLRNGVRVQPGEKKRDPLDFSLWKPAKPGEPSWPSPWGPGRPGWHIECSAMIQAIFGESVDIHGGGMDLIFPHHENERAQSEGASKKPFVKYWVHWNMINFGDRKMSKSVGNVLTARNFIGEYGAEIYKYMILSVHYRSLGDCSEAAIERAVSGLARVYSSLANASRILKIESAKADPQGQKAVVEFQKALDAATPKFEAAMNDDFNTPEAFAEIFNVVRAFNSSIKPGKVSLELQVIAKSFENWISDKGSLMALFLESAESFLIALDDRLLQAKGLSRSDINDLVAQRTAARAAKNFAESDRIRDELVQKGIAVLDSVEGTRWEVNK